MQLRRGAGFIRAAVGAQLEERVVMFLRINPFSVCILEYSAMKKRERKGPKKGVVCEL